jgi:hypothetical protein
MGKISSSATKTLQHRSAFRHDMNRAVWQNFEMQIVFVSVLEREHTRCLNTEHTYVRVLIRVHTSSNLSPLMLCEYNGARFDMPIAFVWTVALVW